VRHALDGLDDVVTRAEGLQRELMAGMWGPAQDVDLVRAVAAGIAVVVATAALSPENVGQLTRRLRADPNFAEAADGEEGGPWRRAAR
jgi:hypothetical protein